MRGAARPRAALCRWPAVAAGLALAAPGAASGPEGRGLLDSLRSERRRHDLTVWAPDVEARAHEAPFIDLWDRLRRARYAGEVLSAFVFDSLAVGVPAGAPSVVGGYEILRLGEPSAAVGRTGWMALVAAWEDDGWQLEHAEFHQRRFRPPSAEPAESTFRFDLHARDLNPPCRVAVSGDLRVHWRPRGEGGPEPGRIVVTGVTIASRRGPPPFAVVGSLAAPHRLSPLIARDLDGDGLSEILAVGGDRLYRNRAGSLAPERLFAHPPAPPQTAVAADLDGDGLVDLALAGASTEVQVFPGDGRFGAPGRAVFPSRLTNPKAMSAGDVDGDGHLDLWVGQYKPPYVLGQMPTPYYDARDGFPAYLLRNGGEGFTDVTVEAGLEPKRRRRTYSGSLADVDADGDLDLVTVSDFAGLDLYLNDGDGRFEDVSDRAVDEVAAFGMAHALADFDGDGAVDLFVSGMNSHVADRLDDLGLGRADRPDVHRRRPAMAFGNRLLLGDGRGRFRHSPHAGDVARSGWTWGCAAVDVDNDGDIDLYVANGNISGDTARDYYPTYWTHDVYTGSSAEDPELARFFARHAGPGAWSSWGGFESNRLFVNQGADGFVEVGYPAGVGLEIDARTVLADDLDADGRVDLLVTEWHHRESRETLHVLRNDLEPSAGWIGVRLTNPPSPVGARLRVWGEDHPSHAWYVTGESFDAQRAPVLHVGLARGAVSGLEVRWADGRTRRLPAPGIDRYHEVGP